LKLRYLNRVSPQYDDDNNNHSGGGGDDDSLNDDDKLIILVPPSQYYMNKFLGIINKKKNFPNNQQFMKHGFQSCMLIIPCIVNQF
jgi:hypothetical protein